MPKPNWYTRRWPSEMNRIAPTLFIIGLDYRTWLARAAARGLTRLETLAQAWSDETTPRTETPARLVNRSQYRRSLTGDWHCTNRLPSHISR